MAYIVKYSSERHATIRKHIQVHKKTERSVTKLSQFVGLSKIISLFMWFSRMYLKAYTGYWDGGYVNGVSGADVDPNRHQCADGAYVWATR